MTPDFINGMFELAGAAALSMNVWRLIRDKEIKGVHWGSTVFFTSWGLWNLFYYPSLDQWWSFAGGVCISIVNLIWLGLIVYYTRFYKAHGRPS